MKRNILAAIDFSECSDYALEWILRHLRLTADDTLTLVTVNEPPAEMRRANDSFDQVELESAAHAQLEKLWNAYEKKIPSDNSTAKVEFKVETGKPMKILIDLCHSGKYTMLFVGSHGKSGARELGSVSNHCLKVSPIPVVVVKETAISMK